MLMSSDGLQILYFCTAEQIEIDLFDDSNPMLAVPVTDGDRSMHPEQAFFYLLPHRLLRAFPELPSCLMYEFS